MKSNYHERKENRKKAYLNLSAKNLTLSNQHFNNADKISSFIPFGQPIQIGHHSEKRHRRDMEKIDNSMRSGFKAIEKSEYFDQKLEAMENNTAISSDNPEALQLLQEKVNELEALQKRMKEVNKIVRRKLSDETKIQLMIEKGETEEHAKSLLQSGRFGGMGYAGFTMTNNNSKLKSAKQRLERLKKLNSQKTTEIMVKDVRIVDNVEDNRLQVFFPDKPEKEICKFMSSNGFRWTPSLGCWQRFRVLNPNYYIKLIESKL